MSERAGWIESPKYDLWLLILPPLFGLAICTISGVVDAVVISGFSLFFLGMPHYLSTYAFYFDDKNMAYARTRKAAFFAGPVLVILFLSAALKLKQAIFVDLVVDAWNVFHVSRQSTGILSIYRHLNGGDNRKEKLPANIALVGLAAGMYFVHIAKQPSFVYYLQRIPFPTIPYIGPVLLIAGTLGLGVLMTRMLRRGARLASPEMIFLATSALLFSPYLLISSRSTATSAMLSGHYIQYLGILWLLNHRKYREVEGSTAQRGLAWISRSIPRIIILLLALAMLASVTDRYVHYINAMHFHVWVLNLVVLMHFYLDGVFWAFKHRHTRDSIGPYLLLPDHRVAPAPAVALPAPVPAA